MAPRRERPRFSASSVTRLGPPRGAPKSQLHGEGWEPLEGVVAASDGAAGEWLLDALDHSWAGSPGSFATVGALLPTRFEAYLRILHPAPLPLPAPAGGGPAMALGPRAMRWAEVAARSGRTLHGGAQFHRVVAPVLGRELGALEVGAPPAETPHSVLAELVSRLGPLTATPTRCWFGLWDGYGDLRAMADGRTPPVELRLPARTYRLYVGPVAGAVRFATARSPHAPTLWWPEDQAWFVGSDPDLDSTYVGCGEAAAAALLSAPELELFRTHRGQSVAFDGDDRNRAE